MGDKVLKLATQFEALVEKFGANKPQVSAQPSDIQKALVDSGLWPSANVDEPFNPNSNVAKKIFSIMDNMDPPYEGKMTAKLKVDPKLKVIIDVSGSRAEELQPKLQNEFGKKMMVALKGKVAPPAETLDNVGWVENVG